MPDRSAEIDGRQTLQFGGGVAVKRGQHATHRAPHVGAVVQRLGGNPGRDFSGNLRERTRLGEQTVELARYLPAQDGKLVLGLMSSDKLYVSLRVTNPVLCSSGRWMRSDVLPVRMGSSPASSTLRSPCNSVILASAVLMSGIEGFEDGYFVQRISYNMIFSLQEKSPQTLYLSG